jgi:thiamine pyrophosphate-dependent acetolactate synthase large subunit-like protein
MTDRRPGFIDVGKYADSYGAKGHKEEDANQFLPLIRSCFDAGGVHIIDVPIDYKENKKALSVTISTTKFNPRRVAVSISCEFIIKPPSPQTAITCRCGYNKAQAIALGNPALVVLIVTDSAFGMIRWKQEGQGLDDFGLEYNNPDFVKYADVDIIKHKPLHLAIPRPLLLKHYQVRRY